MPGSGHRWDPLPGWSGKASQGGENPRDTGALPPARPAGHRCAVTTPGGGLSGRPTASPQEPELPGDRAHPQAQATEVTPQAAPNTGAHPLQRGLGEAPAAEERFWGCAKGPGGPTGLQATGGPPELPRAHPPGLPLRTPGREGPPEAKYTPPDGQAGVWPTAPLLSRLPPHYTALPFPQLHAEPPGPMGREDGGVPGALSTGVTGGATPETGGDVRARVKGLWPHQPEW